MSMKHNHKSRSSKSNAWMIATFALFLVFGGVLLIDAQREANILARQPKTLSQSVPRQAVIPEKLAPPQLLNPATTPSQAPARKIKSESKNIDLASKCKTYISNIMGRPIETMRTDHEIEPSKLVGISYARSDDRKIFKYECRTDGVAIEWRGVDLFEDGGGPGRWRTEDSKALSSL